mgnify:CR=1
MKKISLLLVLILFSCSKNKIETNDSLQTDDINYIKNLGLLDDDEKVIRFYSEYKNEVAGNFFTDKKVCEYWIDKRNPSKNQKNFAFYKDIIKLKPNYNPGLTYSKYIEVTKSDGSTFKICMNGTKAEVEDFVNVMVLTWKKH